MKCQKYPWAHVSALLSLFSLYLLSHKTSVSASCRPSSSTGWSPPRAPHPPRGGDRPRRSCRARGLRLLCPRCPPPQEWPQLATTTRLSSTTARTTAVLIVLCRFRHECRGGRSCYPHCPPLKAPHCRRPPP